MALDGKLLTPGCWREYSAIRATGSSRRGATKAKAGEAQVVADMEVELGVDTFEDATMSDKATADEEGIASPST